MKIGVPKEIKNNEFRVGLTPSGTRELVFHKHEVIVQKGAGEGVGYSDAAYRQAGARIGANARAVFDAAEMIVKVKEPQPQECRMLRAGQILFTYLHLAPDEVQTRGLVRSKAVAIAYETVTDARGRLPLLAPMSEVAGRMAAIVGADHLQKHNHGSGVLLGGVPGVSPGQVAIIGGGVAGSHAAAMALGLGASVVILDKNLERIRELDIQFGGRARTRYASVDAIEEEALRADLVVGAVLIPGATAPKLLSRAQIKRMRRGSVVVDIAIDQGGCFATSKPTTHEAPTFIVDGIVHYCVANMPGGMARTSTQALTNATLPFVIDLANKGARRALTESPHLLAGLNVAAGQITHKAVANARKLPYVAPEAALAAMAEQTRGARTGARSNARAR